jgi:hypothetical protein
MNKDQIDKLQIRFNQEITGNPDHIYKDLPPDNYPKALDILIKQRNSLKERVSSYKILLDIESSEHIAWENKYKQLYAKMDSLKAIMKAAVNAYFEI